MNYKEIKQAVNKVIEANATINCCINFDEEDQMNAQTLYYRCKKYIEDYKERGY